MFVLTIDGQEEAGAYSVTGKYGEKIIYIFQEEDDATRYALLLQEDGYPEVEVVEIDDELMIGACELHGQSYTVITPNDIVIPPKL